MPPALRHLGVGVPKRQSVINNVLVLFLRLSTITYLTVFTRSIQMVRATDAQLFALRWSTPFSLFCIFESPSNHFDVYNRRLWEVRLFDATGLSAGRHFQTLSISMSNGFERHGRITFRSPTMSFGRLQNTSVKPVTFNWRIPSSLKLSLSIAYCSLNPEAPDSQACCEFRNEGYCMTPVHSRTCSLPLALHTSMVLTPAVSEVVTKSKMSRNILTPQKNCTFRSQNHVYSNSGPGNAFAQFSSRGYIFVFVARCWHRPIRLTTVQDGVASNVLFLVDSSNTESKGRNKRNLKWSRYSHMLNRKVILCSLPFNAC